MQNYQNNSHKLFKIQKEYSCNSDELDVAGKNKMSRHIRLGVRCTDVPCRPLPLRGPCDVVQVLYPSRSCPPLFPPIS